MLWSVDSGFLLFEKRHALRPPLVLFGKRTSQLGRLVKPVGILLEKV
jgi:hypothetical protein